MTEQLKVDVVVVGGGPAGLSAALTLGRARRSVVVIDEEQPRNRVTHESHGFLTRDKIPPAELRAIAREQIEAYPSVQFRRDVVTAVTGENGSFQTQTELGTSISSRKVLFATGMKDQLPAIEGLQRVYGSSAFVCPYCDGWELRDRRLVVIANDEAALHLIRLLWGWTHDLSICSNGPAGLPEDGRQQLGAHGIPLFEDAIERIESEGGQVSTVRLKGGQQVPCEGIFFAPKLVQATRLPVHLGCDVTASGAVAVGPNGETSVAGVYIAGDAARERYQLIMAAADGAAAAIAINFDLAQEDWRQSGS